MSNLPIPDLTTIAKSLKDYYDYWSKFKGKKVSVIGKSSSIVGEEMASFFNIWREITEGTIDSVQSYPPGLILKNVEQFVRNERNLYTYIPGKDSPPINWRHEGYDSPLRERFKIKFISFYTIEAIEFVDEEK